MKIVFDCRYVRLGQHDGISRYTAELVRALARLHPVTMLISDERQLDKLPQLDWAIGPAPTGFGEIWTARAVNKLRPDVVYTPMQTMGSLGRRYRLIVTLHDLIYYRNRTPPRDLSWFIRLLWRMYHLAWWPQRLLLNRADAVVTVSETTRELIIRYHLTRRPVVVVPNAVARQEAPSRPEARTHDLVYMGSFMPYKNVDVIAGALHLLPGYRLQLMSQIDPRERDRLTALAPAGSLVFCDGASDEKYFRALQSAAALISASRDEGFGIPLIEAMSFGTPVVVSDIPIFREIGGEAASYFDADSPPALAAAVLGLEEPGEWAHRSALSLERAAEFDWDTSARRLLDLIESVGGAAGRSAFAQ
ncbi:MAG: glycosyltransferase family 4 protein [Microbacteriaceae bacterium]